jgi:glycosyltransferase involved in cell wall biosynthesis
MRLALMISSLSAGGAERVLATLAGALSKRGHDVIVLTDASTSLDHYLLPAGVRRIALNLQSDSERLPDRVGRNLLRVKYVRRVICEISPGAVVAFGDTVNARALLSCVGLRLPVLVSERTDPRQHVLPWPWRALRRLLYPLAAFVVVQTESVAGWARSFIPTQRVRVIPNPVRPLPSPEIRPEALGHRRTVIAVGRLGREKGFDQLLNAFQGSALAGPTWQLVILGEGPERASLQRQVEELGLQGSVLMPGVVRDPEQWLQHAELFVLSSRFEGFPNALLEAMQCGLPVAAFDCPSGPGEIVRHEQTGLLVPPGDTEALSAAISRLANDENLRRRLGSAAAADVATRFSLERISAMWEEMLEGLTAQSR